MLADLAVEPGPVTVRELASRLDMPLASLHRSLATLRKARVYFPERGVVAKTLAYEILTSGMKFMFPPEYLGEGVGVPTAWSARPMRDEIAGAETVYVWPHPQGDARGVLLKPIDPSVPALAMRRPELGELLALGDAMRIGGVRDRDVASELIAKRLGVRPRVAA